MDKLTVRTPNGDDLPQTLRDMVTLRTAPPLVLSAAGVLLMTGSILLALTTVGVTSFVHALWARLLTSTDDKPSA
jgi:hypothetical protein